MRFNVTAVGSEPMTYQWQRSTNGGTSWADLPGFTFANGSGTGFSNGHQFRVVVTNPVGAVTSRAVTLTVTGSAAPSVTVNPVNVITDVFDNAVFAVTATGAPSPTFSWQYSDDGGANWSAMFSSFGDTDVFGLDTSTVRMTRLISAMDGFQFRAVASNGVGTAATSAAATLTLTGGGPASYFTWQPLDIHAQAGNNAQIVAGVDGTPNPSLQWQRSTNGGSSWSNLSNDATFGGVTTSTLAITGTTIGMNGHLFRLNATNSGGSATSRTVTLSVASAAGAPSVTTDPSNTTQPPSGTATFTAVVSALPAPVFQWQGSTDGATFSVLSDGIFDLAGTTAPAIVSGANTRTLTIDNLDAALDGFSFRVVVSNANGSDTSAAASLTVGTGNTAPSLTAQPADTTKVVGENATFTAAANGNPAPTLQWQRSTNGGGSWSDLSENATYSGVTGATLTVTSVSLAMDGDQFRAVATNSEGSVNSNAATLTVEDGPVITTHPADVTRTVGQNATFTGGASGTPTPTLQWQRSTNGGVNWSNLTNTAPYSGVTTGTLTVTGVALVMDGDQFRVVATNSVNSVNSNAAVLTVNDGPAVTTDPANASVTYLGDPTFNVVVSGTPAPTIQWQISTNGGSSWSDLANNVTYGGVTTSTLTVSNVTVAMSGHQFRAVATNAAGSDTSAAATLTVAKATATITWSNLTRAYTGSPLSPTATTTPTGLTVDVTFDGSTTVPTNIGAYALVGTINDANYQGTSSATFSIGPSAVLGQVGPVNVAAGSATTLSVTAGGGSGATFQWQMQPTGGGAFADVAGATGSSYTIPSSQRFHGGTYRVVVTINGQSTTSSSVVVNVTAPPPNNARLVNLSTRGLSRTGDEILIPGFVIGGTGTKRLLIRTVGPTLANPPYNVGGVLPNPRMSLKRLDFSTTPASYVDIDANNDWEDNANAAEITTAMSNLGAFPFESALESALLVDLIPGQYTVFADGEAGVTGVAIVELYDADSPNPTALLANISNRGFAGVGSEVMIPGFVVSSEGPKTFLVRVVGPTLADPPYNVPGTMDDPRLQLFRTESNGSSTLLLGQDDWGDNPDSAFTASTAASIGAFELASGSADAALVVTLEPGSYTVIGSAADGVSTGVIIVEIYVVP
jgi:hypothetical protein